MEPRNRDMTSVFLRKIKQVSQDEQVSDLDKRCFTLLKLRKIMTEMFFAGIETESNTVGWAFLFLVENLEVQEKCRKQILDGVSPGKNRKKLAE